MPLVLGNVCLDLGQFPHLMPQRLRVAARELHAATPALGGPQPLHLIALVGGNQGTPVFRVAGLPATFFLRLAFGRLKLPFVTVASQLGISESYGNGLAVLKRIDIPSSSLLRNSRPHYYHSLSTFLLGYHLFNMSGIDWVALLTGRCAAFGRGGWSNIMAAWFAGAMLHDVGVAIESYGTMLNELAEIVKLANITAPCPLPGKLEAKAQSIDRACDHIVAGGYGDTINDYIRELKTTADHGFLSAAYLGHNCYEECQKRNKPTEYIPVAALAAALHSRYEDVNCPSVHPVAGMLMLCDAIQAWGRDRPDFGVLEGDTISKVELGDISLEGRTGRGPKVSMVVRYYLHSMLAQNRSDVDKAQNKLQEVLEKHVIKPLEMKLRFSGDKSLVPDFRVDFQLGRKSVGTYVLSRGGDA